MSVENVTGRLQMELCLEDLPRFLQESENCPKLLIALKRFYQFDGDEVVKRWGQISVSEKMQFFGSLLGYISRIYKEKEFAIAVYYVKGSTRTFLERTAKKIILYANPEERNAFETAKKLAKIK